MRGVGRLLRIADLRISVCVGRGLRGSACHCSQSHRVRYVQAALLVGLDVRRMVVGSGLLVHRGLCAEIVWHGDVATVRQVSMGVSRSLVDDRICRAGSVAVSILLLIIPACIIYWRRWTGLWLGMHRNASQRFRRSSFHDAIVDSVQSLIDDVRNLSLHFVFSACKYCQRRCEIVRRLFSPDSWLHSPRMLIHAAISPFSLVMSTGVRWSFRLDETYRVVKSAAIYTTVLIQTISRLFLCIISTQLCSIFCDASAHLSKLEDKIEGSVDLQTPG